MPRRRTINARANHTNVRLTVEHDGTVLLVDTDDQTVPRGVIGSITANGDAWHATISGIKARPRDTQREALEDLASRHLTKHRSTK